MKRVLVGVALVASLVLSATPVLAADTYHWRNTGNGAAAGWSNVPWDQEEIPPGTYSETWVDVSTNVEGGMAAYDTMGDGICVNHWTYTVDADGNWSDESGYGACGDPTTFQMDKKLNAAHVVATLPVVECTEWNDQDECIGDEVLVGTFEVDVTWTGEGRIFRHHGTSSGGTAGLYQYTYHGNGMDRGATASGTVTFDGASVLDGTTNQGGSMWSFRDGGVDIMHCDPEVGC